MLIRHVLPNIAAPVIVIFSINVGGGSWPSLCLTTMVYVVNMFGDAMRDLLDPRLRGGGGRLGADSSTC